MCGIYGMVSLDGRPLPTGVLRRMADGMLHRGPDDEGACGDETVQLGMRRLSIIDPRGGHQPIWNEDHTIAVVCNGEIYNFRQLRRELQSRGHRFSSGSDTEVIVHLYEEHGADLVDRLSGMFGLALWDTVRRRIVLARDRLGIKPLYLFQDRARLIFASEAKAILRVPGVSADIDINGVTQYLALGYVPTPFSMFRGIAKLPQATVVLVEDGRVESKRYWSLSPITAEDVSDDEWAPTLRKRLEESIVAQMVSDVPLGAFLSGGIDSSAVVAFMARNSDQPVRTYSIGFEGSGAARYYNELPYARRIAELFGTKHREIIVKPDMAQLMPKLLWHMDEPIADAAFVTTYLVAELAREEVTVILSGVGGDELFGGYRRYLGEYYRSQYNRLPGWFRRGAVLPFARIMPADRHTPALNFLRYARGFILANDRSFEERYRSFVEVFHRGELGQILKQTGNLGDVMDSVFRRTAGQAPLRRLMEVDLETQLTDDLLMLTDKMSMAKSLECRVPLLDDRLVELSAGMPDVCRVRSGRLKYSLKAALEGILPADILHRRKRGFGAPVGAWLKTELAPMLQLLLSKEVIERRGLLVWPEVERVITRHRARKEDYTDHLLALMTLEIWCRIFLDGEEPAELTEKLAYAA